MITLKKKGLSELLLSPLANNHKGTILVLVLWSLCLLAIFAVHLGSGARQKIIMVGRLDARDRLHFIAEAGVKRAILELKKKRGMSGFDALKDCWSNSICIFKEIQLGVGSFTVSYDYLNRESGEYQIRYGIIDEERKININKTKRIVIERLFKIVGLREMEAQNLSASIVDWRDGDSELSIPLGSAEDRYYRNLKESYEAKDMDFEVLEELFLVKGMNREIFDKIKDSITIYGEGRVNINTAGEEVLLSLGLLESVVNKILSFRCGQDLIEASADDNVFDSSANIAAQLSQFYSLGDREAANLNNLVSAKKLTTKSDNFMIKSVAKLSKKDTSLEVICVFERFSEDSDENGSKKGGKIRYWREGL